MRLIDADALYERTCSLEAQALDYVGKLIGRDGDEASTEWKIWSAILVERTAFKHDLFDAPTIEERKNGTWIVCTERFEETFHTGSRCSVCNYWKPMGIWNFCPNCGSYNKGETNE